MPTFTRDVPSDPRGPAFPIVRTPAWKPLTAIVTSDDLIGCHTHYYKGRTMPCEPTNCEACQAGIPYRWHAYLSALRVDVALHCLFECTAQAATNFTDYRDDHGSLRGCKFEARRYNSKPNGRILIRCKPADLSQIRLPDPPDLVKCLAILWDFPIAEVAIDPNTYPNRTPRIQHTEPTDAPDANSPPQDIQSVQQILAQKRAQLALENPER